MPAKPPAGRSRPTFTDQEALQFHSVGRPGQARSHRHQADGDPARPVAGLFAGRRGAGAGHRRGCQPRLRLHGQGQFRRRHHQRHRHPGTRQPRRACGQARDGRQGGAVQAVRRHRLRSIWKSPPRTPTQFINCVRYLGAGWGGINLEDIKAPECFIIEQKLRELLDIPVFHDDQHGTAIIAAAGLLNALDLTGREIATTKLVCNGAGAAGIACLELLKAIGFKPENLILCDTKGVIYQGRKDGMNQWKSGYAVKTSARTLAQAFEGADVFFGLSVKGAVTQDMVKTMAPKPIIFAMANPDPEITAEEVAAVRDDAIMATGRSDYPNQINNVLGFPYIFRGALDVRASAINMEMKIAAARALAELAREDVPDEVASAYGARPKFGPDYIIPVPFDPRLISHVPPAVAQGGDGHRRRAQADRRHGCLSPSIERTARSDRGHAGPGLRPAAPATQTRGLCRGRGRAGDPRGGELRAPGPRHRAAGRTRGSRAPVRARDRHRTRRGYRDRQCAAVDAQRRLHQLPL